MDALRDKIQQWLDDNKLVDDLDNPVDNTHRVLWNEINEIVNPGVGQVLGKEAIRVLMNRGYEIHGHSISSLILKRGASTRLVSRETGNVFDGNHQPKIVIE